MIMAAQTVGHEPNPLLIFEAWNGFQRATALKAAINSRCLQHDDAGFNRGWRRLHFL